MKTIVAAMITCVGLFGLTFGTTKYLATPMPVADDGELDSHQPPEPSSAKVDGELTKVDHQSVPVSFRPSGSVSVEAIVQMSDSIRRTEQQLSKREERVAKDEQRISLLFKDLQTEQDELSAFSDGIDAKVELLSQLTEKLKTQLADLDSKNDELRKLEKAAGVDDQSKQAELDSKVADVKSWFEGLQPDQAASYLKEFANKGKLTFAASLLHRMPDRQKSKILGAMSDPVLVDQLIDSLTTRKPE